MVVGPQIDDEAETFRLLQFIPRRKLATHHLPPILPGKRVQSLEMVVRCLSREVLVPRPGTLPLQWSGAKRMDGRIRTAPSSSVRVHLPMMQEAVEKLLANR